jgi:hypothetical protein
VKLTRYSFASSLAMNLSDAEADQAVSSFIVEMPKANEDEGFGFGEVGDFLGPIARVSDDAARRVSEFRSIWGSPQNRPGE